MTQIQIEFELQPVSALVPHEMTDAFLRNALLHQIRHNQYLVPIVADRQSGVVLDGHHRLHAARALGLTKIPVVFLDYADAAVEVHAWRSDAPVQKADVLEGARRGLLFVPKTTKHMFHGRPVGNLASTVRVPLTELV